MRTRLIITPIIVALVLAGCWRAERTSLMTSVKTLELIQALPVDMSAPLEPSGLVLYKGNLFTVADKDNRTIYKVIPGDTSAKMVPHLQFDPPEAHVMDWEGITIDPVGNFYLISEFNSRILQVRPNGDCQWISPNLAEASSQIGLFAKSNAGFEGITWLGPDHWLGAVEREPRGLVEFRMQGGSHFISPMIMDQSPFSNALTLLRIPDYSGLCQDNEHLYALFRGAHLVVELERKNEQFQETRAWSYKHIETDPKIAFLSQTYGQAEGLVVSGKDVYLIFDNNLGGRQSNPKDGRPLFVHARMP